MTISDRSNIFEQEIRFRERIAELEKTNQELSRLNLVFEGINRIFSIVVQDKTEEELGNECLFVALEITGSPLGFVNLVGDDGLLHDIAISDMGWKECLMYDKTGHRRPQGNFVVHGLYGRIISSEKSFFTNNPLSHPNSIGIPSGHPQLTSFLGVPLVLDGKIVGILGVANREGGYSHEQQADLEAITPAIVQAISRKKSELERKRIAEKLQGSLSAIAMAPLSMNACVAMLYLEGSTRLSHFSRHGEVSVPAAQLNCWPLRLMSTVRLARVTDAMVKAMNPWF
jgi:hypothetical protein